MRTHPNPIFLGQKPFKIRVYGKCLNQNRGVSIRKFEFPDGNQLEIMDSRFDGNDEIGVPGTFYETLIFCN
jgi:hypothetical protein